MVKIQIILLWIKLARFVSNIEKWDFLSDFQTLWWSIPAKHSIAAGVRQASTSHGSHSRTFGACGRRWFWALEGEKKKTKKIIAIFSIFSADAVFVFLTSHLDFDKQDFEQGKMFSYVGQQKLELVCSQDVSFVHYSTDRWKNQELLKGCVIRFESIAFFTVRENLARSYKFEKCCCCWGSYDFVNS